MARLPSQTTITTIVITLEITTIRINPATIVIIIRISIKIINLAKIHNSLNSITKPLKITQQRPKLLQQIKISFLITTARSFVILAINLVIHPQIAHRMLKIIQLHKLHLLKHNGHKK